jgi:hypothetical protein
MFQVVAFVAVCGTLGVIAALYQWLLGPARIWAWLLGETPTRPPLIAWTELIMMGAAAALVYVVTSHIMARPLSR